METLSLNQLKQFILTHYLKNRTIVSKDIAGILDDVERLTGLPMVRHRYKTGEDHGTWIIPPQWDIREAWLKDKQGRVIASHRDHPLFVPAYSKPVHHKSVTKLEMMQHISTEPRQPDAYPYDWRYAFDARLRLKDWGLALPKNVVDELGEGSFEVLIDADVRDGEMLIGEIVLPGESDETFCFLADYCHTGQVNDSFSGLITLMQVMNELVRRPRRRYTYKLLILPETIGSAVYVASDPSRMKPVKGTLFSEMVGWGEKWYLQMTRRGNTYLDLLAQECSRAFPYLQASPFLSKVGNDELIFDSVQVGIPSLSLVKNPYPEYHTSNDEPSRLIDGNLIKAVEIVLHLVDVMEKDRVVQCATPVPFWMTRFDLFADDIYEPEEFARNFNVVYRYLDGKNSVLKIAQLLDCPFEKIESYVRKMELHRLVKRVPDATPWSNTLS